MSHYRKGVRDKIKTILTGNVLYNSVAVPIYQTRVLPYWEVDLPAISFYTLTEDSDDEQTAPRFYNRDLKLVINILIHELASVVTDDIVDEIAEQLEILFERDPTLGKLVNDMTMVSTSISVKENGDKIYAAATMIFSINTKTPAPISLATGTIKDFSTANIQINPGGGGSSLDALTAKVTLP